MRLEAAEREAIAAACQAVLSATGLPWELRLYGSRVDDTKRGGDIDLAVILDAPTVPVNSLELKLKFLVQVKAALGDRRIDFSILAADKLGDPFWQVAFERFVTLAAGPADGK